MYLKKAHLDDMYNKRSKKQNQAKLKIPSKIPVCKYDINSFAWLIAILNSSEF